MIRSFASSLHYQRLDGTKDFSLVLVSSLLIKTSLMSIALVKAFNYEALLLMGHEAESFYSIPC